MEASRSYWESFALRPLKGAVVSEISEATASSPVPAEERVNFHIGNPIQDPRLVELYARIALGLAAQPGPRVGDLASRLAAELGWEEGERDKLEFLLALIRNSAPYLPRGGFLISKPNELIRLFRDWMTHQAEPLAYDFGEKAGRREVILASGGILEALRVFFHALANLLEHLPATIFVHGMEIPEVLRPPGGLVFRQLPENESQALAVLRGTLEQDGASPAFVILGRLISEETRRALRHLCCERPLFPVEANDAPNHLSLAREAQLMNRTLRFLTPAIFNRGLARMSTVFVAGFEEFIRMIETVHFQLKGTPSATEVELLTYLLKQGTGVQEGALEFEAPLYQEAAPFLPRIQQAPGAILDRVTSRLDRIALLQAERLERRLNSALDHLAGRLERPWISERRALLVPDPLEGVEFREILDRLPAGEAELVAAFKASFLRHHPEYLPEASVVVSGSARTALGLLGFHCGIREVFIPDLSWTYEHCFPSVISVPLTPEFEIDVQRMIAAVEARILREPDWIGYGAVVFNNPHNATGRVFSEEGLRTLLRHFLGRGIRVIDDLSYQNVAPSHSLQGPLTLRQIADDLSGLGYITSGQADLLVTVHSLSKTDCLAGARLSVVEIREVALRQRLEAINRTIVPNVGAILLAYLFYRSTPQSTNAYWRLRNVIFEERMAAIEKAAAELPPDRNPYGITITRPTGSMYPRMTLHHLPSGVSLEWIAAGLARQGIGLIPLSTFAHTEDGFETGRKSFRLTLGGADGADRLEQKTRRVLIDLNRLIADEESHYNRRAVAIRNSWSDPRLDGAALGRSWTLFIGQVSTRFRDLVSSELRELTAVLKREEPGVQGNWGTDPALAEAFLKDRCEVFSTRFNDRLELARHNLRLAAEEDGRALERRLEQEFARDNLDRRQERFRRRLYDRTVHPTQMYSISSELLWDQAIDCIVSLGRDPGTLVRPLALELAREYLGLNVAIDSRGEGSELLLELRTLAGVEDLLPAGPGSAGRVFLSYWGDWDGSNRPSGQGHRLVASVVMENVAVQARLLRLLVEAGASLKLEPELVEEVRRLPATNRRSRALFDEITDLTHQLERRYRGLLPFEPPGILRRIGMRLRIARDPVFTLWEHNDQLERRMLDLRRKRRRTLEYYFRLNKSLRECLRANLGEIRKLAGKPEIALAAAGYRDLLSRFVVTPRIHQNLVTSPDPFAIDTTAHNIMEINEIAGRHGNPGMVLALQVSMSSDAEALIALDRRMRAKRDEVLRSGSQELPSIWLVPLYESVKEVQNIQAYLGKLWDYAVQSRRLDESTESRFSELLCEVFIAGSDLSQQIGQTAGVALFKKAKHEIVRWLAERKLVGQVRVKMGSGEPMQRQGGYYAPCSGQPAFRLDAETDRILGQTVEASAKRSARYATTPLMGVFASGDLRTFQSNLSERLRHLPAPELTQLLHHVAQAQQFTARELRRAAEPLTETRLQFASRGLQELERLTMGLRDPLFDEFMKLSTENFRRILYGEENDVVGIYLISYFIARAIPPLRDRPTVRPAPAAGAVRGQRILERIAATIPFSAYGSSLRAIAHNQAQTFVLGVNQLTTGLFRTFNSFAQMRSAEGEGVGMLADRILPHLPVYEILQSLRLFQDMELHWLGLMERGFPAGNSAFTVLREDIDSIRATVPLFQREVVRRHGVQVHAFFERDRFIPRLLPTLRPDLAVLLQEDIFNTDLEVLLGRVGASVPEDWSREVARLLDVPRQIRRWRAKAWELLREPVFLRTSSFVELATALYSVARKTPGSESPLPAPLPGRLRDAAVMLNRPAEDSLQQFLVAAYEYLSTVPRGTAGLPTNVVRAMKEVERLARIEEQALPPAEQSLLRFYLLQIARAAGENG